jgi:cytochrome P450
VKLGSLLKDKLDFAESFDAIQFYNFRCFILPINAMTEKIKENLNFWKISRKKTIAQHLEVVNQFAYDIIQKRRFTADEQINKNTDLLYRFMTAKNAHGKLYNDEELRDTMLNFVVAGRDTSAQTLSWFFYNVMMYPRIERKLLDEIDQFITDGIELDTVALYEATKKMTYSHAV